MSFPVDLILHPEFFDLFLKWCFYIVLIVTRYLLFAGTAFAFFYWIRRADFLHRKIQNSYPLRSAIWHELKNSAGSVLIFASLGTLLYYLRLNGITRMYLDLHLHSIMWIPTSAVLLILIHDTYFYWVHRWMHRPRPFRLLHAVHHGSRNPTPLASLSFHPLETLVEFGIIPMVVFVIPLHPISLFLFLTWSLAWNVLGHLGFEFFPRGWVTHPVWKWFNTSTHHNMHHERVNGNYGLYFNFWDRVMGTNHPHYEQRFEEIKQQGLAARDQMN